MFPKISQILQEARAALRGLWRKSAWNEFILAIVSGKVTVAMALAEFIYLIIFLFKAIMPKYSISSSEVWLTLGFIGGHIIITLIRNAIGSGMQIGLNRYYLEMVSKPNAQPVSSLKSHLSYFANQMTMNLSRDIGVAFLSMFFLVPGLMAKLKWAMADYEIAQEPTAKGQEAITGSGFSMEGKKWKYFLLQLALLPLYIPVLIGIIAISLVWFFTNSIIISLAAYIIVLIPWCFADAFRKACKARFFYYIENPPIDTEAINKLKTLEAEKFNFEDFMVEYEEKVAQKRKQNRK